METFRMITGILFLLLLFTVSIGKYRTYKAIQKVKNRSEITKIQALNDAVAPFGYLYEYTRDLFATTLHPWQREMGYCKLYDESAVSVNMIIHCEPIEFEYAGMLYLIEFWKGQYGMTTGAEVGIYKAQKPENYKPGDFILYQSVSDEELIYMSMALYKNGKPILERSARHWWLTGFLLGEYTNPEELAMRIQMLFPNFGMKRAFIQALYAGGYSSRDVIHKGLEVVVYFAVPKSEQPLKRRKIRRFLAMKTNSILCKRYLKLTSYFEKSTDRIDYLRFRYPLLAFAALHFSKTTRRTMEKSLKKQTKKDKERLL